MPSWTHPVDLSAVSDITSVDDLFLRVITPEGEQYFVRQCPDCQGKGRVETKYAWKYCVWCNGSGKQVAPVGG